MGGTVGTPIPIQVTNNGQGLIHTTGGTFTSTELSLGPAGSTCVSPNVMKTFSGAAGTKTIDWTPSQAGNFDIQAATASGYGTVSRGKITITVKAASGSSSGSTPSGSTSGPTPVSPTPAGAIRAYPCFCMF